MKRITLLLLVFLSVTLGAKADVVTKESITTNVDISTYSSKDTEVTYESYQYYTMTVNVAWNGIGCSFSSTVSAKKLVVKLSEAAELKVMVGTSSNWSDIKYVESGSTDSYELDWSADGAKDVYQIHIQGRVTGEFTFTEAYLILADGTQRDIPLSTFTSDDSGKATYEVVTTPAYYNLKTTAGWKGVTFSANNKATKASIVLAESAKFKVYIAYDSGSEERTLEASRVDIPLDPTRTVADINIQPQEVGTIKLQKISLESTEWLLDLSQTYNILYSDGDATYEYTDSKLTYTVPEGKTWTGIGLSDLDLYFTKVTIEEDSHTGANGYAYFHQSSNIELQTSTENFTVSGDLNPTIAVNAIDLKLSAAGSITLNKVSFEPYYLSQKTTTTVMNNSKAPVHFYKSFKAGWNSFCVPFEMPLTDIAEDAKAYTFTSYDGTTTATFTQIEEENLSAGVPYLLKLSEATTISKLYEGKTLSSTITNPDASNNMSFKGNYEAGMDMEGKWGVTSNKIMQGDTGSKLNAFAAYFEVASTARELNIAIDDEATGISLIDNEPLSIDNASGAWYSLDGRKFNGKPTAKGLYIVNGKKVIIK